MKSDRGSEVGEATGGGLEGVGSAGFRLVVVLGGFPQKEVVDTQVFEGPPPKKKVSKKNRNNLGWS